MHLQRASSVAPCEHLQDLEEQLKSWTQVVVRATEVFLK